MQSLAEMQAHAEMNTSQNAGNQRPKFKQSQAEIQAQAEMHICQNAGKHKPKCTLVEMQETCRNRLFIQPNDLKIAEKHLNGLKDVLKNRHKFHAHHALSHLTSCYEETINHHHILSISSTVVSRYNFTQKGHH